MSTDRQLPAKSFAYNGLLLAPESLISEATKTSYVIQMILSNITSSDVLVTLKDNQGTPITQGTFSVSAYDQVIKEYPQGWYFANGIRTVAATGSAVQIQLYGQQEY